MTMRIPSVAVALLCAGTVAACGSSSGTTTTDPAAAGGGTGTTTGATTTVTRTATATATPTQSATPTTGAGTTTGGTTTTSGAGGVATCRAADLALSYLGGEGATGHGELGFALHNTSHATCHTYGYPGVQLLDGAGRPLPVTPTRTTDDFFGHAPEKGIDLGAGDTVSFRLAVSHVGSGGGESGCTTARAVQVIPPNDTATLHVTIPGGAYACAPVTVSPVQPGTSAFQH